MAEVPPPVFDRSLTRRRLARSLSLGKTEDFLLDRAVAELRERLGAVKRRFTAVLDAGTPLPRLCAWAAAEIRPRLLARMAPLLATAGDEGVLRLVSDEEALPFSPQSFDLVLSALSLQSVNDLPGALVQLRQLLKPDGLFLGCLLGGSTLQELRTSLAHAEMEIWGGISPRVAPFADVRDMGGLLQRACFALPVADAEHITVRYSSMFGLLADLRAMGATNALCARLHKPASKRLFMHAAEIYAEHFSDPDGRLRATFEMIFLSGWAPHESQQKPLRPGSAKMRLEDALALHRPEGS